MVPDRSPVAALSPLIRLFDAVDLHNERPTPVTTARVVDAADALVRAHRVAEARGRAFDKALDEVFAAVSADPAPKGV